jgi:hypothetical protein
MLTATSVEEPAQIQHNALGPVRVLNFTSTVARTSQTIVSLGSLMSVQMLVTGSVWGALLLPVCGR